MIPRLIAITPPGFVLRSDCRRAVQSALEAGLPAIMLRDKSEILDEELAGLCPWLREMTHETGAKLIVNRRLELARRLEADGIHLGLDGPSIGQAREVVGEGGVIGWSAHSVAEALNAVEQGADYVTLSPIFETPGKGRPIGIEPLRELTRLTDVPVIALGGIGPENIEEVIAAGAHGVAVIRSVFESADPAAVVREMMGRLQ